MGLISFSFPCGVKPSCGIHKLLGSDYCTICASSSMDIICVYIQRQTTYVKGLQGAGWHTEVKLNLPMITPQSLLQRLGLELSTYGLLN